MTLYIIYIYYYILYIIRIYTYIYIYIHQILIPFYTFRYFFSDFQLAPWPVIGHPLFTSRASALSVDCRRVSTAAVWSWGRVAALITASSSSSSCFWDDSWISDCQFLDFGLDFPFIQLLGYLHVWKSAWWMDKLGPIWHWRMRLKF